MSALTRHANVWLLWALVALSLAGCRAPDSLPPARTRPVAPVANKDPLDLAPPPLIWEPAPEALGGRRVALIVAVDEYAERNWNLPFVQPSAALLESALRSSEAFEPGDIVIKSGDSATRDSIAAQLERWALEFEGPDNVLFVYWVGHGFNIDGEQQFLTWASRHDGNSYAHTVPYRDLTLWMNDAQRGVRERGGELSTALVVDACRTRDQNAPGKLRQHSALVDVEAFSAAPGSPSTAHATRDVTIFADAFASALARDVLTRDVRLLPALQQSVASAAAQGAVITTGERDLVLLDADDLSVAVQATDALTGKPIPGARVQLNGEEQRDTAVFRELAETAEGYDLLVRADGYFWRTHSLDLARERAGSLVSVPLRPEFVVLQGRIELRGRGVARISVTGAFDGLRSDYHNTSQTLTNSGGFRLRVPPTPGPRSLVVEVDGREARRIGFDLAELPSTLLSSAGTQVRLHDMGIQILEPGASDDKLLSATLGGAVAAQVGGVTLSFSFDKISERDFTDAPGWSFFTEARDLVQRGDYAQASRDLAALVDAGRVRSGGRRKIEALAIEVDLAELLGRVDKLQGRGELDAARDLLDASPLREHEKVSPLLVSWFGVAAREARQRGELDMAAAHLERAMALAGSRERHSLRQDLQALRIEAIERGFEQALRTGDDAHMEALLDGLRDAGGYTAAREWRTRIDREVIRPACRERYEAGVAAQSRGDLELAFREYERALLAEPNTFYERRLEELRDDLGEQLFKRYNATAAEHYNGGELELALLAYLEAFKYDGIVRSRIERLIEEPSLRETAPELIARAESTLGATN